MKPQVLFICLGNSCRSIMAEALARHFWGTALAPASGGLNPLGVVAPETLEVLAEIGVATTGLRSKGLDEIDLADCRLVVNLTHHSLGSRMPPHLRLRVLQRHGRPLRLRPGDPLALPAGPGRHPGPPQR